MTRYIVTDRATGKKRMGDFGVRAVAEQRAATYNAQDGAENWTVVATETTKIAPPQLPPLDASMTPFGIKRSV